MMKFIFVALFFAAVAVASDVKILTTQNFDSEIATGGGWLLEFYAPWCGHCKNLAPIYEELATKVKGEYNIAKVDCTQEKALQKRFEVRGFPTIKFLKDGKLYDYRGQRTAQAFIDFMAGGYSSAAASDLPAPVAAEPAAAAPAAADGKPSDVVQLNIDNFEELTSKGNWFLKFYAPWCGHCKRLAPIYDQVSNELKGQVNVGKINCDVEKVLCGQYGIRGYPTVYYKRGNELRDYDGERTAAAFKKFALDGGWQAVTPEPIPEPISLWKMKAYALLGAVENGVSANMWLVIGACVVLGVVLGAVVVACTSSPQPPAKTIHYTAVPTESSEQHVTETEEVSKDD